jgi:thiol-disulfide isomerase/thioredoxin
VADEGPTTGTDVGQRAPEIEGEDFEGRPFRLSDYRGRVVVLVFWGHWCSLCRAQFGHHRSLVECFRGQPFALLGVNSDEDWDLLLERNRVKGVNWRSWWEGSRPGPVARAWGILGWPHVYVLDPGGVVRFTNLLGPQLEEAVEGLLREMPAIKREKENQL